MCPDCGLVVYCNYDCLEEDEDHAAECGVMARLGRLPDRDEVRVLVRAISKLQEGAQREGKEGLALVEGGGQGDEVPEREGRRTFGELMSHSHNFLTHGEERKKHILKAFEDVEDILQERSPSFEDFMEVLGRLYINGFEICDDSMESYGWGIYLGPSIMDHSCSPNAIVSFAGNRLTVTTTADVASLDDLRISYTDTNCPANVRKQNLMQNYFFVCECPKCRHVAKGREETVKTKEKCSKEKKRNKGKR